MSDEHERPEVTAEWEREKIPRRDADVPALNTDGPDVRCYMGHRCKWGGPRWIYCSKCCWSSHDPRRVGVWWRLRVWLGR